jgi:hypothetical protein
VAPFRQPFASRECSTAQPWPPGTILSQPTQTPTSEDAREMSRNFGVGHCLGRCGDLPTVMAPSMSRPLSFITQGKNATVHNMKAAPRRSGMSSAMIVRAYGSNLEIR